MNRRFVADASVGVKLCIQEASSDRALALFKSALAGNVILIPDLFYIEYANILWKYIQRSGYPEAQAKQDMAYLLHLNLAVTPTADLAPHALDLATRHSISAYDACYVALANLESAVLITADEKLYRRLNGSSHRLQLLSDLIDASLI